MEIEGYYEKQKELFALKQKLRAMKNKERMNDLNGKLQTLTCLKNELFENLTCTHKNMEYINENIKEVKPLLENDNKISMKHESVMEFKNVVQMVSRFLDTEKSIKLQRENLNVNTEKLMENVENSIQYYNANISNTTSLFCNIQTVVNDVTGEKHRTNSISDKDSSSKSLSNTIDGMITFSEAIASSPL